MGRVHPKSGMDDQLRNWGGHVGPEGWVASVDGGADLRVVQAVGVQKVRVGDHRSETVVVAGAPQAVGCTVCREMVRGWALRMHHRWWYKNISWGGCELMYMRQRHGWDGTTL